MELSNLRPAEGSKHSDNFRRGRSTGNWILMDYYDVIIHVFDKEHRLFYDIERIWKDGRKIDDNSEL